MKRYEFILKENVGSSSHRQWEVKFRNPKVMEKDFDRVKKDFEKYLNRTDIECILLINELDENGEFVGVIQ